MADPQPLRIGILGAARIASEAIIRPAAVRDDVTVVAVAARDPARAAAFADAHGIPEVAADYATLIERDDLDLVYIALPPHLHCGWAIRAMTAGRHVLCEKPLAMNGTEASAMVAASAASGRLLIEAFHYRFHPMMRQAVELVRAGAIGRVETARAWAEYPIPPGENEIRWRDDLGGGALMDLGCYPIHALRSLLGTEPEVISARRVVRRGVDAEVDVALMFPGKVSATVSASMTPPEPSTGIDLIGDEGRIEVRGFILAHRGGSLRVERKDVMNLFKADPMTTYTAQLAYVVKRVEGATEALTEGLDVIQNTRALEAVKASWTEPTVGGEAIR